MLKDNDIQKFVIGFMKNYSYIVYLISVIAGVIIGKFIISII